MWKAQEGPTFRIEDNLQCVVSIGTGIPSLKPFGSNVQDVAAALLAIATSTERVAEDFHRRNDTWFNEKRAFRFNVVQGLQDIGLEEASKQGEILAMTKKYIATQRVLEQMKECAQNLRQRECMTEIL